MSLRIIVWLPILLLSAGWTYHFANLIPPTDAKCYSQTEIEVLGSSMSPLIQPGSNLTILKDYYRRNEVKRFDVIAYNYTGNKNPIIKAVYGVPGDRWEIREQGNSYNILVNGKILKNSEQLPFLIPKESARRLELYSQSYPIIPENAYIILGNNPSGSLDSSSFGLIHKTDIIGRIVAK